MGFGFCAFFSDIRTYNWTIIFHFWPYGPRSWKPRNTVTEKNGLSHSEKGNKWQSTDKQHKLPKSPYYSKANQGSEWLAIGNMCSVQPLILHFLFFLSLDFVKIPHLLFPFFWSHLLNYSRILHILLESYKISIRLSSFHTFYFGKIQKKLFH